MPSAAGDVTHRCSLPALLNDNEVVVVSVALKDVEGATETLATFLSTEELARASRFRFRKDRDEFIASRASLRACLAHYLEVEPRDVSFAYSEEGKPKLDPVGHAMPIEFNLSHTRGLVAIALSRNCRVGIDVEKSRPVLDELEIAEKFFSPAETEELRSLSDADRRFAFLCCWTRKEAYAKATGLGLSETLTPNFDEHRGFAARFTYHPLSFDPDYVGVVAVEGDAPLAQHARFHSVDHLFSCGARAAAAAY